MGPRKSKLRVFICYPDNGGLTMAKQAAAILQRCEHSTYVFDEDKTLGVLLNEELSDRIMRWSDVFLYICTASSPGSWGQRKEVEWALNCPRLNIVVVNVDGAQVPRTLSGVIRKAVQSSRFEEQFQSIAEELPETVKRIQRLDKEIRATIGQGSVA